MATYSDPILVVEDSEVTRMMTVLLFEKAGYEVVAHEDGDKAMEEISGRNFSLLVLDQQLPGKSGIELLAADRKYGRNTPAVFVTGNLQLDDAVKISHLGIAGIFTKPADPAALLAKAREIVGDPTGQEIKPNQPSLEAVEQPPEIARTETPLAPPSADRIAYPVTDFPAASPAFITLTHRLWKVRNFRNTLLLFGTEGTMYSEIARDLWQSSDWSKGLFLVYPERELEADQLLDLLAHTLVEEHPATVLIRDVHRLDSERQELLRNAIGFREVFMPFAQRVRFVLTSDSDLNDELESGLLDETLYFHIGSVTANIPSIAELEEDVLPLARHFLETCPKTGSFKEQLRFDNSAIQWLGGRTWAGDFTELKHLVACTVHFTRHREITAEMLENIVEFIEIGSAPSLEELTQLAEQMTRETTPVVVSDTAEGTRVTPADDEADIPEEATGDIEPDVVETAETEATQTSRGVASYLPSSLSSDEIEKAISESTVTRRGLNALGKREINRKEPGSYDFSKRLADTLAEEASNE
ncbi:MAG: hypothetical protein SynsKO_36020 [Synoicihabitans sp.]